MVNKTEHKISPKFSEKEIEILKHYFEFNKRYQDEINEEMTPELKKHPLWGPILGQMTPEQLEEQRRQSLETQRAAIYEGKWEAYSKSLIEQGIAYARMNISYFEWYKLIKDYREQLFPHLIEDFPESKEVITYMEGTAKILDFAMYSIAEAYFTEKNNIIRSKDALFQAIFDHSVDYIMVLDRNMVVLMINRADGGSAENIVGKRLDELQRWEGYETVIKAIHAVLENKMPLVYETEYIRDNEKLYFSSSLSPILDQHGEVDKIISISRDISEKQKAEIAIREMNAGLETKVSERTDELKKSITELEQFAYVASHDLQEPLRTISNYVNLFTRSYKDKIDEDTELYLKFINTATQRMQMLIHDLLQYSRTGHDKTLKRIDCNELVEEVLNDLEALSDESMAKVNVEKLPVITAYPDIKSLFQNLISNAIKFRKKDVPAEINISATGNDQEWIFAIKDNGIGIDKQYHDRIFMIFQKLHNNSEYVGTGIGLSLSKKIVEMHKGRIWIDSEPGHGSTFYFTISKNTAK